MKNYKKQKWGWSLILGVLLLNQATASINSPPEFAPLGLPDYLASKTDVTLFEVGQVRPLALSHDGGFLFATNTPDDRLEIFTVSSTGITPWKSISVGLRPVALAEAPDGRVWVVNHLSDSVSVVNIETGVVEQTLWVGDEPRDIVFAGKETIEPL